MHKQQGFTLIELTIVMVILGLMMTMLIPVASSQLEQQRRKETISKMAVIDQAIVAFVMTNKRLPCPANGTIPSGTFGAGQESPLGGGNCGPQTNGVIPWITLGLSEADATDGYYSRFTYRVSPDGASNGVFDTSNCDPLGNAEVQLNAGVKVCKTGCDRTNLTSRATTCTSPINFFSGRGLRVVDDGGNLVNDNTSTSTTGAAYVLISHMAEGGGGYSSSGILTTSSIAPGTSGTCNETSNLNGQPLAVAYCHANQISTGTGAGANHFDDLLSHPSISQLLAKAQLAPRSQ